MTPHIFNGFSNTNTRTGAILERIVWWEPFISLGRTGSQITLDDGSEILVGELPEQVKKIIEEKLPAKKGEAA